jgi:Gluconate 2-dehydrogenase subunit 3
VPHHQESRIVAISAEHPTIIPPYRTTEPAPSLRLQQLIDNGAVYVAQNLSHAQFATLQAIAALVLRPRSKRLAAQVDAALSASAGDALPSLPPPPIAFDYQLGLDELDTIARTRTGYPFAELPAEIQDAILGLIASGDLTTRKLDLALWLEDLHTTAAAAL